MENELQARLGQAMESILMDHQQDEAPFARTESELGKAVGKIDSDRDEALFKTLTTALNYQRQANPHYATFGKLWDEKPWLFEPEVIIEEKELTDINEVFEENGVRFPRKDAKIWYDISLTLYTEYDSDPLTIFEEANYDFDKVEQRIRDNRLNKGHMNQDFPYLRGEKIRPLWLRFMKSLLPEYTGFEETEVAVDTHIISITSRICGTEYSETPENKDEIRSFWREVCEPQGINPIQLDIALWYINRDWEEWGEEYLRRKLAEEGIGLGDGGIVE